MILGDLESTWVLAIIGAVSTIVVTLIRRDTAATRQLIADQRIEIRELKEEIARMRAEIVALRDQLGLAADENLRLMRKLLTV